MASILRAARRRREDGRGGNAIPLRGRHLAVLVVPPVGDEAATLESAVLELGARVAQIRVAESYESDSADLVRLARVLGRMYDAIECGGMAAASAQVIKVESCVPTYSGLGLDDHPTKVFGDLMTLCDCQDPSAPRSTIRFLGDGETRRARAFREAACDVGFNVALGEQPTPATGERFFVVDAASSPRWSLHGPGAPIDQTLCSANHRLMIQMVLLDTMVEP